jgi:indole-3-glycerol phosphate synthase
MLEAIVDSVKGRLGPVVADEARWRSLAERAADVRDFAGALVRPGLGVVAEIKRRSPSAGNIDPDLDATALAAGYADGGAVALSVLTEPDHFGALPDDLPSARSSTILPVLRKDFIIHRAQVWQTRAMGADAVLLIAAILDDALLSDLVATATQAGLDALVEIHAPKEAARALASGAQLIGVNNRDLATFEVDLGVAERIRPLLDNGVVTVAESGVSSPEGAARMRAAGYDAVLVGEAAVRSGDPARFIASLREAAR